MKVAIGSMFRNAQPYITRYVSQVNALKSAAPQHVIEPLIAEGDCSDETPVLLRAAFNGGVRTVSHGGPVYGSVCDAARHRQMSMVKQSIFDRVTDHDAFIYVEGDLHWGPEIMLKCLEHLSRPEVDLVAPFCWHDNRHYDSWGMRGLDGVNFGFFFPYHRCLMEESPSGLYQVSSAGSCVVMRGEVARRAKFSDPDDEFVGFCHDATAKGYKIWLDPELKIYHP